MYSKVMVALDDNAESRFVLDEAARLADDGSGITVVTVADDPIRIIPISLKVSYDVPAMREAAQDAGRHLLEQAKSQLAEKGVHAVTHLIDLTAGGGEVAEALVHDAEAQHADLLVIGTHGRHGLRRMLVGSVADQVIRQAKMPVLLVRAH